VCVSASDLSFLEEEPYLSTLLAEYEPRFGEPTFPFHAHAFDATNRLLDIIQMFERAGSQQIVIPRTALRDAFAATSGYPGVSGSITCDANGDCNPQEFVIRVVQGGEFVAAS
jgi:branched-chain amino acid transport system substrate-binding protein